MSKTATIALAIQESGSQTTVSGPTSIGPYTVTGSAGIFTQYMPQAGDNFLVFPLNTNFSEFWIDPTPANSGMALTLKGVPSDVGVPISTVNPSLIPLAQTDWRINPAGGGAPVQQCVLNTTVAGVLAVGWL